MVEVVRSCVECQQVESQPAATPLIPWSWPSRPWSRIHLDFAGPMEGRMFLVAVDAHEDRNGSHDYAAVKDAVL